MPCSWCIKTPGLVFANPRSESLGGSFAFLCSCEDSSYRRAQALPKWNPKFETDLIPEYLDDKLTDEWVIRMFEQGDFKNPEFQRRMKIWGRPRFESIWKEYKKTQSEKNQAHESKPIEPSRSGSPDELQPLSELQAIPTPEPAS
jgi:hypothetical protein